MRSKKFLLLGKNYYLKTWTSTVNDLLYGTLDKVLTKYLLLKLYYKILVENEIKSAFHT